MRVLILGLNFAPELVGVGKYTADFAAWLGARGHEVRVVTAPPYYPEWRVGRGYAAWRYRRETVGGAIVLRCPLWVPAEPSPMRRVLHLISFAVSSFLPCVWQAVSWRPDVVWAVEPTSLATPVALLAARLSGATACLHVQDLEIEAASELRMLARSRLYRLVRAGYGWLLRRFDLVSTISERMRRRLAAHGLPEERLCLFPNWVDTGAILPLAESSPLRAELGFGADQLIVLYAGSMGEKQGLEGLAVVVDRLADCPAIRFVLCGAGAARPRLERLLAHRPNVTLLPLQPRERLNDLLNLADIHVLPQRAEAASFALPSRLGGMLASGRPVVAQTAGGELARAARAGGVAVTPDEPAAMASAILALGADDELRHRLGRAARRFAETHLDRELIIQRYVRRVAAQVAAGNALGARWARLRDPGAARLPGAPPITFATPPEAAGRR
ncbi:MAG TPA: WcaI family glycosyltransferase [Geminicoccaceae bacterium]|nr:WcaI family glycosyltransferase [Geminicoccaceae bacterium]